MDCARCGKKFNCGIEGGQKCWCASLPPLRPIPKQYSKCLCPACLEQFVETANIEQTEGLIEGEDFYYEGGLMVFTRSCHLKRGHCCESGCRFCPY